jgi:hypothetical protein
MKNITLFRNLNRLYGLVRSAPARGAIANVTNAERNAMDVKVPIDERHAFTDGEVVWSWRPEIWRQVRDDAFHASRG